GRYRHGGISIQSCPQPDGTNGSERALLGILVDSDPRRYGFSVLSVATRSWQKACYSPQLPSRYPCTMDDRRFSSTTCAVSRTANWRTSYSLRMERGCRVHGG